MKNKQKVKGKLRSYLNAPLILGFVLVLVNIGLYTINLTCGFVVSGFLIVYFVVVIAMLASAKPGLIDELVSFATEYGQIQKRLLKELELPYALLDEEGRVIWINKAFEEVVEKDRIKNHLVHTVFPEITKDRFPTKEEDEVETSIKFGERDFRVNMKRIDLKDMALLSDTVEVTEDYDGYLTALYLFDETALNIALKELDNQSLVVGLIYIDNYEEAMESVEDVGQSLLAAFIDRQINQYVAALDGIIRKTEKDKYILILRKSALAQMIEDRFKILDDVRGISIGNETAVTLSIGIGVDGLTYSQNSEFARNAIDLALGRGGDQAVVKYKDKLNFYGGKSQQKESNTRVRARVKAHALEEIISSKDKVFVMGHANGDADSFGACVGIKWACTILRKECHIVLDEISTSLRPLVDFYLSSPDLEEDAIITGNQALEIAEGNTVLVVVDVNRPSITQCPELIRRCKSIVVMDHHRQGEEYIENATLSYVEPYASSACEMVAEMIQYIGNDEKPKSFVSECLYSGIVLDTQNFTTKTGVRTFDAASYLRRNGADVTRVRKMFRENAAEYKTRADAVRRAEIFNKVYAISYCVADGVESPTVLAAQAANELLNIKGIRGSFVLSDYQNKIFISARSIDEMNVQIVMERMGGGGHMNIAGCQLQGETIESATELLKDTLTAMIEEGAI